MTPKEIISKNIISIEGIRIPFAKIIIENIMNDLKEEGYVIIDELELKNNNPKKDDPLSNCKC